MKEEEIRVNKKTGKVEICNRIDYIKDTVKRHWEDYDTMLLASTLGQCGHSESFYPLLKFKEHFDETKAKMEAEEEEEEEEKEIRIRYVYLGSPSNMRTDRAYHETLRFNVLTIAELELRPNRISFEELVTTGMEVLIRILGRDRSTGLRDVDGEEIFENDIIRWYPKKPKNHTDDAVKYSGNLFWLGDWYENEYPDTDKWCKVIGTTYDNEFKVMAEG